MFMIRPLVQSDRAGVRSRQCSFPDPYSPHDPGADSVPEHIGDLFRKKFILIPKTKRTSETRDGTPVK